MAIKSPQNNAFEQAVKAVIAKNYPGTASRGLLNVTIQATAASTGMLTDSNSSDPNAPKLFFWGTSMFGGARVVL